MTVNASEISAFIQIKLNAEDQDETTAVEAASWLDRSGLLSDSRSHPGKPLRNLLRAGSILGAEQRPANKGGTWFISRIAREDHFLLSLEDNELPRIWGMVMEELRSRGIVHSGNSPIGDIGEFAVTQHLKCTKLAPPNTAGYDVMNGNERIQVKSARIAGTKRSNLSPIRKKEFDTLVVVIFNAHLEITELMKIDSTSAFECSRWSSHVNGWLPTISKVRNHPDTIQIPVDPDWSA